MNDKFIIDVDNVRRQHVRTVVTVWNRMDILRYWLQADLARTESKNGFNLLTTKAHNNPCVCR